MAKLYENSKFFTLVHRKVMILPCRLMIPVFRLFQVYCNTYTLFINPRQVTLTVSITMLRSTLRPIQGLFQILFGSDSIQVKIPHLALSQRITLLGQLQMSLKAFFMLCCIPVAFDQVIADIQFFTGFIIIRHFSHRLADENVRIVIFQHITDDCRDLKLRDDGKACRTGTGHLIAHGTVLVE